MPRKKGSTNSAAHNKKIASGVKSYNKGGVKKRDGIISNNEFPRDARGKKIGSGSGAQAFKNRMAQRREGIVKKPKEIIDNKPAPTMTPELKAKADAQYNHIKKKYGKESADRWEKKQEREARQEARLGPSTQSGMYKKHILGKGAWTGFDRRKGGTSFKQTQKAYSGGRAKGSAGRLGYNK